MTPSNRQARPGAHRRLPLRTALVVGLLGLACSDGSTFRVRPAPGVGRVAAVVYDRDDRFLQGSPVRALEGSAVNLDIGVDGDAAWARIYGWSLAGFPGPAEAHDAPVRPADPSEPWLPEPLQHEGLGLDQSPPRLDSEPPPLTVDWLSACPQLGPEVQAHISCTLETCTPELRQDGCQLSIDEALACSTRAFQLHLNGQGTIDRLASPTREECELVSTPAGSLGELRCPPDRRAALVDPCVVTLEAPSPPARVRAETFTLPSSGPVVLGLAYASALVTLPDGSVLVASHEGRNESWACGSPALDAFQWLDLDRQTVARSVPAPSCVTQLLPDSGGFLAISGTGPKSLGIYDSSAALLRTIPIPRPTHIYMAARFGDRVVIGGADDPETLRFTIVAIDLLDGSSIVLREDHEELGGLTIFPNSPPNSPEAVALDDSGDIAYFLPMDGANAGHALGLRLGEGAVGVLVRGVVYDASSERLMALCGSRFSGLTSFNQEQILGRMVRTPTPVWPRAMIQWPASPGQWLVAATGSDLSQEFAYLVEPRTGRVDPRLEPLNARAEISSFTTAGMVVVGLHADSGEITLLRAAD